MNYLQEIYFHANKNVQFTCHIISTNSAAPFGAEVLVYDPVFHTLFSSLHPIGMQYQSAEDAYIAIVNFVERFCSARSLYIQKINNPCNDHFINKTKQQAIINSSGISVSVLVNGQ